MSDLRSPFTPFFALISACGILKVYWTKKTITQVVLKRYLLLADASAKASFLLWFHFLVEGFMVTALFVCPIALIVGTALALRFQVFPQAN